MRRIGVGVRRAAPAAALALVVAAAAIGSQGARAADARLSAATWNLYAGAPFDLAALPADPTALGAAADAALASAEASDVPARMDAVARQIAATRPDVIGLQEAVIWRVQEPGDGFASRATQARIDSLASLRAALCTRGLCYRVAALSPYVDVEVTGVSGRDIRLTDRDAILVRADRPGLRVAAHGAGRFARNLTVASPYGPVEVGRGWAQADLRLGDRPLRVMTTHLEPSSQAVKLAQGRELAGGPAGIAGPVVVLGDFNARPGTSTYRSLTRAGLRDGWRQANGTRPGRTCCHDVTLTDPADPIEKRIDLVMVGNGVRATAARLIGDALSARTPSGLWPSDHIGVVASLRVPGP